MFGKKSLIILAIACFSGCQARLGDTPTIPAVLDALPAEQRVKPLDGAVATSPVKKTITDSTFGGSKKSVALAKIGQPTANHSTTSREFLLKPNHLTTKVAPQPVISPDTFKGSLEEPQSIVPNNFSSDGVEPACFTASETGQGFQGSTTRNTSREIIGKTNVGSAPDPDKLNLSDSTLPNPPKNTQPVELTVKDPSRKNTQPVELTLKDPSPNQIQPVELTLEDHSQSDVTVEDEAYIDMTIEQAVRIGLQNSKVIRDLGGTVLRNPEALASAYDPSITHSNPLFGEEAALSEFDAILNSSAFFENNDRELNNQFLGTNGIVQQDLGNLQFGITKRVATGGVISLRSVSDYDNNNSVGNRFGTPSSSWQTFVEGEMRQPLLRGSNVNVNRIAGPGAGAGEFNGIAIAKSRTNISVSEFKISVRNLVSDIENAYWDLYFAYRDLEAKKAARDNALQSWRRIKALGNEKKIGGEADKEGQAREQYFRFEAEVQDAIYGRPDSGTSSNNGSTAGTFRPVSGLKVAERRFRFLVGLSMSDDNRIRPVDEPVVAPTTYDRDSCLKTAFANRSELKRQLEQIRQVELQMIAAENALLPQLDLVGRYRFRGFGSDLIGDSSIPNDSASADLFNGDFQEWQLGMEVNIPLGSRREFAAIRNIEQRLLRERSVLNEQKRQITADIGNALDNVHRAYLFHALQHNRLIGALDQLHAVKITNEQKKAPLNLVLEAQRRVLDAQTELYRAKVEFALARRSVEFEKGTLLPSMNVRFSDTESLLESDFYLPSSP